MQIQLLPVSNIEENSIKIIREIRENEVIRHGNEKLQSKEQKIKVKKIDETERRLKLDTNNNTTNNNNTNKKN